MSVSGVINTHFIVAYMIAARHRGAEAVRLLPKMATGEMRGAFSMSEPELRVRRVGHQEQGRPRG